MVYVWLPASVTYVGPQAFYTCPVLETVYYTGSEAQFRAITVEAEKNDAFLAANVVTDAVVHNPAEPLLGDADGDRLITSTDARMTLQVYAGKIGADKINADLADVDGDGEITSTDARMILQKYAGKIDKFPAE
jgi:hypothetical protein